MTVKVHTKIQNQGMSEGNPGMMEYGYGLYINAYVVDTEFAFPELDIDGNQGMYATEKVRKDASEATISKARRRARDRARDRYRAEKARI